VWQAAEHVDAEIYNGSGALVWNETAVPDPDAARKFYAAVFDYAYQPVEGAGPAYTTVHLEGDPLGGIGRLDHSPSGAPPHWMTYFMVADTDVAVAAATELGTAMLGGPVDFPTAS
jgi:uncharacterized protein